MTTATFIPAHIAPTGSETPSLRELELCTHDWFDDFLVPSALKFPASRILAALLAGFSALLLCSRVFSYAAYRVLAALRNGFSAMLPCRRILAELPAGFSAMLPNGFSATLPLDNCLKHIIYLRNFSKYGIASRNDFQFPSIEKLKCSI